MRHLILLYCLALAAVAQPMQAGEAKRTVVDYYLLLPKDTFEGPAADWLKFLRQPSCGLVDVKNGYMSCTGDGAQPSFEVALFRYTDGRPLLALCMGELEGDTPVYLTFYGLGADGKMHALPRDIFPVKDFPHRLRFDLPRKGRTIQVREAKSGRIRQRLTWDGEKFHLDQ
jgi:hypothetical protein